MPTAADPESPSRRASALADSACLPTGFRLNEYVIERPLGGGGFGITYLARDGNLQLPVAIKEYFPSDLVTRAADQSVQVRTPDAEHQERYEWGLERFLDEARALATFRHPNIIRVLRYFREHGTAYIVMEYESGLSLKRWLPGNTPLSQRALLSIVYPMLDGLEAVHKTGFLHRDIKPDNIYVRADGTPVLLDFGAARRVSANQQVTNIISPGYAPFEQYHSEGNQGPWTDIYSLGAVMYWMTTGQKPVESAARVVKDTMMPASRLADARVYGAAMLEAIDWAMHPDETRRPQTVALLRAAILGSEKKDLEASQGAAHSDAPTVISAGSARSQPLSSRPSAAGVKRNLLCSIVFLDLVGHSAQSVDDQAALHKLFNELIAKSVKSVPEESRIGIDTGDGTAICFMGDPEEALNCALLLRDLLGQRYGNLLSVRIGLHMGPVRIVSELDGRVNVAGDGINVAQRIMDFAKANQVLVSRAYYDVVSRIADDTIELFQYLGQFQDKHGRLHELYAVTSPLGATTSRRAATASDDSQAPAAPAYGLADDELHEVESELARHIGPLARVLVRKAARIAPNLRALREALATSIHDPKAREAFVAGPHSSTLSQHSHPVSKRPSGASLPVASRPLVSSRLQPGASASTISGTSSQRSSASAEPAGHSATQSQLEISADELLIIERTLSRFIGPLAKVLIKREKGRAPGFKEFVDAIAATVDRPEEREEFRRALRHALPRRQQ